MNIPENLIDLFQDYWRDSKLTAEAILRQSDFYIQFPKSPTPWSEEYARKAQTSYYLPLNYIRSQRVFEQLKNNPFLKVENFFAGIETYWEIGSGLSPTFLALHEVFPNTTFKNMNFSEYSSVARELHQQLLKNYFLRKPNSALYSHCEWHDRFESKKLKNQDISKTLMIFSYALTEFEEIPSYLYDAKALIIIEPATREDGRRLLNLRQELIKQGFEIWAPCLHHSLCPLLNESKTDWCHDRVVFKKPEALQKIENYLPIKNETLTLSYLIAKKKNPLREYADPQVTVAARVIGDFLDEKGKSRQMVCRSSHREFLAQLKRKRDPLVFERGDLIAIPLSAKSSGNEIRMLDEELIKKISHSQNAMTKIS
jgi:ribosomal protein RSM22 (predicted rRNA methylase)